MDWLQYFNCDKKTFFFRGGLFVVIMFFLPSAREDILSNWWILMLWGLPKCFLDAYAWLSTFLGLRKLTESQKEILRYYINKGNHCNALKFDNPDANKLRKFGVLIYENTLGNKKQLINYTLSSCARKRLLKKTQLLEGETNKAKTDKNNLFISSF